MSDADEIPAPVKLAHIVLRTAHLDASIQWWTTVLGAHRCTAPTFSPSSPTTTSTTGSPF
ncbi:MAG TPA: VOC family protein [Acidimicrobiia bacterium]|nr:VOC family protein [Acidimicrobiia bacterium]